MAEWALASTEGILESLLRNRQDAIAAATGKFYKQDSEIVELLMFAVDNQNEYFLKYAFRDPDPVFGEYLLYDMDIIGELLKRLYQCN